MPSEHSVDAAPVSRRLAPVSLESIASRLEDLEQRRDSGDQEVIAQIEALRREVGALSAAVASLAAQVAAIAAEQKTLADAIGESPNPALDKPGRGMSKQVTDLVNKSKAPTIASYATGAGMGLYALYEVLKALGVFHK